MSLNTSHRHKPLRSLTSMRFIAAVSIFLHHLQAVGLDISAYTWNLNLGWAVSFFFVLSGFVLSYANNHQFDRIKKKNFLTERFFRLWPLHITCTVIFVFLFGCDGAGFLEMYLVLSLQQSWIPSYGTGFALNSVSWSISVELFFYMLFPWFAVASTRALALLFVINSLGVAAAITVLDYEGGPITADVAANPLWYKSFDVLPASFLLFFPPVRLLEFLAGIISYRIVKRIYPSSQIISVFQTAGILALLLYASIHASIVRVVAENLSPVAAQAYTQFGMFPLFAFFISVISYQHGIFARILSWRPIEYLGEVSFAFYLIHQIAIRATSAWIPTNQIGGTIGLAFLAFIVSLIAASFLHHLIELPTMRWIKRRNQHYAEPTIYTSGSGPIVLRHTV